MTEHVRERRTITSSVSVSEYIRWDESGADAVAGDIADQYIRVLLEWSDQAESPPFCALVDRKCRHASLPRGWVLVPGSAATRSPA